MGCLPFQRKVIDNHAYYLGIASKYGDFLVSVVIDDKTSKTTWQKDKKNWFNKPRKVILELLGIVAIRNLQAKSTSLTFEFAIPFSKENLKVFQHPFAIDFEYANTSKGFRGQIFTAKIEEAYVVPEKEETKIVMFLAKEEITVCVSYVLVGKELLDDLKQFALEGVETDKQKQLLLKAFNFVTDRSFDKSIIHYHHRDVKDHLLGDNTQELLIKGFQRKPYEGFEWVFKDALRFYSEKAPFQWKSDESIRSLRQIQLENLPVFPTNFEDLFEIDSKFLGNETMQKILETYLIHSCKPIYQSDKFFKKLIEDWLERRNSTCLPESFPNAGYFNNFEKTKEIVHRNFMSPWFEEAVIKRCFQKHQYEALGILYALMEKYPETKKYMLKIQAEMDWNEIKGTETEYFLRNYFFTPR